MGGDEQSREALTPQDKKVLDSFLRKSADSFLEYINNPENIEMVNQAPMEVKDRFVDKCLKHGFKSPVVTQSSPFTPGSMASEDEVEAPSIIKERVSSEPVPLPESGDIEYYHNVEFAVKQEINTLRMKLVFDPDVGANHAGPWIEQCHGRNAETHKLMVNRMPAKEIQILPHQVIHYRGSVVMDHNAVHTETIIPTGRERIGYTFDRFFYFKDKKHDRCCLVEDRIHQAGLIYEKWVPKHTASGYKAGRAYPRMRRISGTESAPKYEVFGYSETDYRDLKRLYERHYLRRADVVQDEDPALRELFRAMPLIPT